MNASNLGQLRPRSRNPSNDQVNMEPQEDVVGSPGLLSPGMLTFNRSHSVNSSGGSPNDTRDRRGSGSYKGAYESDDDIAFKGVATSPGYEPLLASRGGITEEERLKRKLKFFFFNPVEKFYATRQLPWKLCLQILKVFIVTTQLWIFADYRYSHVNYYTDQTISFEHFFIKDWDQVREIHAYPPSTGILALYRKSDFFDFVDFVVNGMKNIESDGLGPFFRNSSLSLCVDHYKSGNISRDLKFEIDPQLVYRCIYLPEEELSSYNSSSEWLAQSNLTMPWPAIERITLAFNLTSVTLRPLGPVPTPDCFKFKIKINLDNADHDGQIPISLTMAPERLECPTKRGLTSSYSKFIVFLNLAVILISLSSLLLCLRALLRAQLLKHETCLFLQKNYGWSLSLNERLEFLNLWYVMITTNDCLIILGSVIKQLIESRSIVGDMWDVCSLMLGTGNLLVWFGLLRYLGFFKTYNVLILTMKGAAPNMLRFLICAAFIYIGFTFAGWVILGPYHFKFSTLMSTSECLFSLINGDDMFATFNSIPADGAMSVWVYSRVYLYTFICLFIYVVLSLFISIIMDTYEIIKNCYERGFPPNRLEQFYNTTEYDFRSGQYSGEYLHRRLWRYIRSRWIESRNSGYEEIH